VTLDLARVIGDLTELVAGLDGASDRDRHARLRQAWETLDSVEVNRRYEGARTSFLLPRTTGDYRGRAPLPPCPPAYAVAGTDGSFILPDRHSPARFYLLNIGKVLLRYGPEHGARLETEPRVYARDEDLYVPNDLRRAPVNETIIGLRRAAAELTAARELLAELREPGVALQDGTLILWSLESERDAVVDWVLPEFLEALDAFRVSGVPLASYISAPGSAELLNMLRVAVCDYPPSAINCDHCRGRIATERHTPACDVLPGVTDKHLLAEVARLQPGERTTVYASQSKVLDRYAYHGSDDLRICYFYVNVGHEIGRVEIPRWVAEDLDQLDLVHTVVFDQCRRGQGYPTVLQEAHELAVLSMADRKLVERAIERQLAQHGIVATLTGKGGSKRVRSV
jgi:hypothetical protein